MRFEVEARRLRDALGESAPRIEHVGSTAVPGLAGKPTIDIAVVSATPLPPELAARLVALGYEDAAADSRPGEHRFRKGPAVPREVIVHVVAEDSADALVRFRDALRADPGLVAEYESLKREKLRELGGWYSGRDKEPFIRRVLEETA